MLSDIDLASLTTLALPGRAAALLRVESETDLDALPALPRFVLGGGSNLVVAGNFAGLVLQVALKGKQLADEDAEAWYVEAAAGENWHDFVLWTLDQGWPGLENLALIPGQVGAAPVQNIGAYGLEAGELVWRVHARDLQSGEVLEFDRTACRFDYRDSVFKQNGWHKNGRMLITRVVFRLPKDWRPNLRYADLQRALDGNGAPTPRQIADAVAAVRQAKLPDPARLPNAGSFFENPILAAETAAALLARWPQLPHYPQADGRVKLAAGWLIEQAGWKGRNLGPVGMYEKQALVLVNRGGASGVDLLRLVAAVQQDVRERFGVELRPEPVFLGSLA